MMETKNVNEYNLAQHPPRRKSGVVITIRNEAGNIIAQMKRLKQPMGGCNIDSNSSFSVDVELPINMNGKILYVCS